MEELFFYPADNVQPIEIGVDYRDYKLSDVLAFGGKKIHWGEFHYASGPIRFEGNFPRTESYMIADIRISEDRKEFIAIAPLGYYRPISKDQALDHGERKMCWTRTFGDLRIRYYLKDGEPLRPVWVSSYVNKGKRVMVQDEYGHWRSTYPPVFVEYPSGYGIVDDAPGLLRQSFIQKADNPYSFLIESDRIERYE